MPLHLHSSRLSPIIAKGRSICSYLPCAPHSDNDSTQSATTNLCFDRVFFLLLSVHRSVLLPAVEISPNHKASARRLDFSFFSSFESRALIRPVLLPWMPSCFPVQIVARNWCRFRWCKIVRTEAIPQVNEDFILWCIKWVFKNYLE